MFALFVNVSIDIVQHTLNETVLNIIIITNVKIFTVILFTSATKDI